MSHGSGGAIVSRHLLQKALQLSKTAVTHHHLLKHHIDAVKDFSAPSDQAEEVSFGGKSYTGCTIWSMYVLHHTHKNNLRPGQSHSKLVQ